MAAADSGSSATPLSKTRLTGFQTTRPTVVSVATRVPVGRNCEIPTRWPAES